jgi:ABC-type Mn2+/Zn2+ transport system permease subunit
MAWLTDPFQLEFMRRAALAGLVVATVGGIVGTYIVHRGLAFLGDALAHGILPGIAVAFVIGFDLLIGAAVGAVVMVGGIGFVNRRTFLSADVAIGLLFVGMLALGVAIVSSSGAFTRDLFGFLFGDILGVSNRDLVLAGVTLVITLVVTAVMWRPFFVLCLDDEKAEVLGFHAAAAQRMMLLLVALAIVASFEAVGTLLVFGMLVAPAATGALLMHRLFPAMVVAVMVGWLSVLTGLVGSYHFDVAASASVVVVAVVLFFLAVLLRPVLHRHPAVEDDMTRHEETSRHPTPDMLDQPPASGDDPP